MKTIKTYTLKYYCLGAAVKDNNFRVYLRYYVTIDGKTESINFNTNYTLTKEQTKLLNANELGGHIQKEFDNIRASITQVIKNLKN